MGRPTSTSFAPVKPEALTPSKRWRDLGTLIWSERKRLHLSRFEVADRSGIPTGMVLDIEIGTCRPVDGHKFEGPSDEELLKLAGVYDVSAEPWLIAAREIRKGK